jgi:two-component system, OmpR family, sensor kinase
MKVLSWLIIFVPLLAGVLLDACIQILSNRVPVLVLRVDVGTWLLLLGGLTSILLSIIVLTRKVSEKHYNRVISADHQQQEEAHRRFLRQLDHELKNPLTAMRAALVNLLDTENHSQQPTALEDVKHQAERLSRLVSDLRKLADLEVRPLERLPVNIGELLQEVVETACAQPAFYGRKIQMVLAQVPWPLSPVTGDRDLLELAFYNLVENALKFTRPEDTVEIRAAEDGRRLSIEVADTGAGIEPEDLPRVFEELYRGTNARGFEGSGLGLSLVQRVISRHGGEITVRSRQDKHQGTVFTVQLPISKENEPVTKL